MKFKVLFSVFACGCLLLSCSNNIKEYKSRCKTTELYHKINLTDLIDSVSTYNNKFIEITGLYKTSFEESALFEKSIFGTNNKEKALWVNFDSFNLKCPLLLQDSSKNLITESINYKRMNDKTIILRGKVDTTTKGHLSQYAATISEITYVGIKD